MFETAELSVDAAARTGREEDGVGVRTEDGCCGIGGRSW